VLAALYDGSTVRLWDGTHAVTWKTGTAVHGNGRKIAIGRTLYFLDASGAVTSSMNLPATPKGLAVIGDPVVYTFEVIDPQTASGLGGMYDDYTRIWKDGVELGSWLNNKWKFDHTLTAANGDVIAVDTNGHNRDVSRDSVLGTSIGATSILWAIDGGPIFFVQGLLLGNSIVVLDADHPDGWIPANNGEINLPICPSPQWQAFGNTWYDGYGDTYSPTNGIGVSVNDLRQFANGGVSAPVMTWASGENPVMVPAYVDDTKVYFIEANSGNLISLNVQTQAVALEQTLYQGNGLRSFGVLQAQTISPNLVAGALYYHENGTLWSRDSTSTAISAFSTDQQMWVMK
jgi:hypothetical protein